MPFRRRTSLDRFLNLGITPGLHWLEVSRIRVFNYLYLLTILAMLGMIVLHAALGNSIGAFMAVVILMAISAAFSFSARGKIWTGRWVAFVLMIVLIGVMVVVYGWSLGIALTFQVFALGVVVMFNSWRSRITLLLMILGVFLLSDWIVGQHGPLVRERGLQLFFYVIFAFDFFCAIALIRFFLRQISQLQEEADSLLNDLDHRNQELEQANIELGQFVSATSHHFKSPLKNTVSLLTLVERKLPEHSQRGGALGLITLAKRNASFLYNLVGDILKYARLEADGGEPLHSGVDLQKVALQVVASMKSALEAKKVNLLVKKLPRLRVSEYHLESLLEALISNAVKYNHSQRPEVIIRSQIRGSQMIVEVEDNGIGINPAYHEQIFGMFTRLHSEEEFEGTGIGLAICEKIMRIHGGEIRVESKEGAGSVFQLCFPAALAEGTN